MYPFGAWEERQEYFLFPLLMCLKAKGSHLHNCGLFTAMFARIIFFVRIADGEKIFSEGEQKGEKAELLLL
jgi:hypothetical protein